MSELIEERPKIWEYIILGIAIALALFPIYWLLRTSISSQSEWLAVPPVWWPNKILWENYQALFMETGKGLEAEKGMLWVGSTGWIALNSIRDSIIIAGLGTLISVGIGLLAAFGISRHRIGGAGIPFLFLFIRMAPPVVAIIPLIVLYSNLGLIDTHLGLILAYALFTAPYSVWMIKSFIDEIPKELEEVALIEGLTPIEAHLKITVPLIKGGIAATSLFLLILNWSEFLFALVLTHGKVITLPVKLTQFTLFSGTQYGPQAALGMVAAIPLIIFGFIIQRYLVRGLTFGAIKR
jgi:multiple sugar transport system permease protein